MTISEHKVENKNRIIICGSGKHLSCKGLESTALWYGTRGYVGIIQCESTIPTKIPIASYIPLTSEKQNHFCNTSSKIYSICVIKHL